MKRDALSLLVAFVFGLVFGAHNSLAQTASTACVVSADGTYGYTKENPIKVGGGPLNGPPREHAYLENLLGPKGEKISYRRAGPIITLGRIIDIYEINGLKETVTLYIDKYSYAEPQAPAGFTCASEFPLTKPRECDGCRLGALCPGVSSEAFVID